MKLPFSRVSLTVLFWISVCGSAFSKPPAFEPISEEELKLDAPKYDAEADVEYLYRSRVTRDRDVGSVRVHEYYNRLKVFTENGVKDLDVINLFYEKGESRIRDFAARVTNPDGTVVELDKSDLYDRKVLRRVGYEAHAKSFSFPQLQVGSIVEYAWDEVEDTVGLAPLVIKLLDEWPTHVYRVEVFPYTYLGRSMRGFNFEAEFETTDANSYVIEVKDLHGYKEEPYSPSYYDANPWIHLRYYDDNSMMEAESYWKEISKELYSWGKSNIRPNQGAVKKLANTLFDGVDDPEEKLRIAYRYATEEIKNIYSPASGFTDEERAKLKNVDSPAETIKRGYGTGVDISFLFASLAEAAGFEAALARSEDRSRMRFNPAVLSWNIVLPELVIAIRGKGEEAWRFFDPAYDYIPFGKLDADCMAAAAIIGDRKEANLVNTPVVDASFSEVERDGRFELSEWGDLVGTVTVSYSGYTGIWRKRYYDDMSESEREEAYCENYKSVFPNCEISAFKMENLFTREDPLVVSFEIVVPSYAESLGKRIFFQPSFFQFGAEAMFEAEERKSRIVFSYPWTENDQVWIQFPEGFKLEEAASPGEGVDTPVVAYATTYGLTKDESKMRCKRILKINSYGFDVGGYPKVKRFFDMNVEQDTHMLTLVKDEDS